MLRRLLFCGGIYFPLIIPLSYTIDFDSPSLRKVFKYWKPPVRRMPPLVVARIIRKVHPFLVSGLPSLPDVRTLSKPKTP